MNSHQYNSHAPAPYGHSTEYGYPLTPAASMRQPQNDQIILVGLTAISKAVGAGPGTIKKWIRQEAFPVRKCSDGIYRASAEAIKNWFA